MQSVSVPGMAGLLLLLCAATAAQTVNTPDDEPCRNPGDRALELKLTGGLKPRLSTLVVDGHFSRKKPFDNTVEEGKLSAVDFKKLNDAVLVAKLSTWKADYDRPGDGGCCDRIHTELKLGVCGSDRKWARYNGGWYSLYAAPGGLRAVLDATRF